MAVTSVMHKTRMELTWINRLVIHNALVYNELENDLFDYVFKQSILFRKRKSHFFRDAKKVKTILTNWRRQKVCILQKMNGCMVESFERNLFSFFKAMENFQVAYETLHFHTEKPSSATDQQSGGEKKLAVAPSHLLPDDVTKSPLFSVAIELLNWGIVYNCRRSELYAKIGDPK